MIVESTFCIYCTKDFTPDDETYPVGVNRAHTGCTYEGSDAQLFDTWIHPVLDLSHVSMSPDLNINAEALNLYLRTELAERDNRVLHAAAEKIRAAAGRINTATARGYEQHAAALAAADLIHPEHDGECNADDEGGTDEVPVTLYSSPFGIAKETTFGTYVAPTPFLPMKENN